MIVKTLAWLAGIYLILIVLALRGLPVFVLLKSIPLILVVIVGIIIIWAALPDKN